MTLTFITLWSFGIIFYDLIPLICCFVDLHFFLHEILFNFFFIWMEMCDFINGVNDILSLKIWGKVVIYLLWFSGTTSLPFNKYKRNCTLRKCLDDKSIGWLSIRARNIKMKDQKWQTCMVNESTTKFII